jgi:uncharacterized membrane protein YdjX (TVP38/TMEM64 family)
MEGSISSLWDLGSCIHALATSSPFAVGGGVFFLTALLAAFGVPGTIVPLSFTAGAVLGVEIAGIAVAAGGMAGSQVLFFFTRRSLRDRARTRLGTRFLKVETAFGERGVWCVLGLRAVGLPGAILTSACALLPIDPGRFALTSFFGLLPATFLAATAGAAL